MRNYLARLLIPVVAIALAAPASSAPPGDEPILIPYAGCGQLTMGVECSIFVGLDGVSFSMTGGGQIGDFIYVTGNICLNCVSFCQQGAIFLADSVEPCDPVPSFDQCGKLIPAGEGGECTVLHTEESGDYIIGDIGKFQAGDYVRVTGFVYAFCPAECGFVSGCIFSNTIEPCGQTISECGTLVPGGGGPFFCLVFQSDSGPTYGLNDTGAFGIGSRVYVKGEVSGACGTECGPLNGCIKDNSIIGCPDFNMSGTIDVDDLLALINAWGPCPFQCPEDLDIDGDIDVDDLLTLINLWS